AGSDRLGDVADDGVSAVAARIQVGVVDAYRPAGAAVGGKGRGGKTGELAPGQAAWLRVVHRGELGGGQHIEIGVQPPARWQAGQRGRIPVGGELRRAGQGDQLARPTGPAPGV